MAELEAITDIRPTKDKPHVTPAQYGRRFPLIAGKPARLGRDEGRMDCAVPEDDQISRFYANLAWDGARLAVERRGSVPPDFPDPPANKIVVRDPAAKDKFLEVLKCQLAPGESCWIGQTQFTVRAEEEASGPEPSIDATFAPRPQEERTRQQLEEIQFTDPKHVLKAMEQLPNTIRAAANEQGLFRQMLKVIMDALPRADAAAIVRVPPDAPPGEKRLAVVESNVRPTAFLGGGGFAPSRKLAHRAIVERRRSCLHCWAADGTEHEMTLAAPLTAANFTPWAVCTPFQDGTKFALYVAGRAAGQFASLPKPAQDKMTADLTQYQKVIELIVGLLETTLRMNRLARQNTVIRQAWHRELWPYMDDPVRLEAILQPQEKEVTILFCDLRDYSGFASRNKGDLHAAWRNIASALDVMTSTITDLGGVVSGFRGDAVLGFWGWPEPRDKQVEKAAKAAVRIPERLAGWLMDKRCGLGLTHGRALAGRLGAHDLAVVDLYGPVVNLAFRLEGMTKAFGVKIIVTEDVAIRVAEADPGGDDLRTRKLGNVRAKGFPEAVPAFELYSVNYPSVSEWQRQDWDIAVDLVTDGKWAEAYETFSSLFPDDSAAQCLMRVMNATDLTPPHGWDGSFVPPAPPE